jgi:hypothetical protein
MLGFTSRGRRAAFTLIEMSAFIVVITSITLILIGMLLPAREAARRLEMTLGNKTIQAIGTDMIASLDELDRLTEVTLPAVQQFVIFGDNSAELTDLKSGYEFVSQELADEISRIQALQIGRLSRDEIEILLPALRTARELRNGSDRMAMALRLVLFIPGKGNAVSLQIQQRQLQLAHGSVAANRWQSMKKAD